MLDKLVSFSWKRRMVSGTQTVSEHYGLVIFVVSYPADHSQALTEKKT